MPLTIFCIALGAALYRWRGGPTWLPAPRWLKLALCASLLAAGAFWHAAGTMEPWSLAIALAGFLAAFGGLSLGHGAYYDLAHTQPEKPHDRVGAYQEEPDFAWLRLLIPSGTIAGSRYWYELAALGVTGLAATAGPGVALALVGVHVGQPMYAEATCLALSGALKSVAYAIGWRIASGPRATAVGEWLTGAAMGLGVGIAVG